VADGLVGRDALLLPTFVLPTLPPPRSTLFPYTTLFRSDQILGSLERDLHRRLPEEQRIVAHAGLHRQVFHVGSVNLPGLVVHARDRKSTRLNSSHLVISYAVFCLKKNRHRNAQCSKKPP